METCWFTFFLILHWPQNESIKWKKMAIIITIIKLFTIKMCKFVIHVRFWKFVSMWTCFLLLSDFLPVFVHCNQMSHILYLFFLDEKKFWIKTDDNHYSFSFLFTIPSLFSTFLYFCVRFWIVFQFSSFFWAAKKR